MFLQVLVFIHTFLQLVTCDFENNSHHIQLNFVDLKILLKTLTHMKCHI